MHSSDTGDGSDSEGDGLADQIYQIERSLIRENWLPFSLRGMLAMELPSMAMVARGKGRRWRQRLSSQLLTLSLACWAIGPSPMESETMSKLQALDRELQHEVDTNSHGSFD
ncbi:hypothetical protein [Pelagicoccus albus]|uniref:Uncharacterized protein n=1 Tax=Pelagicoccus albus TaxID=415222 RepID=A0A7X1B7H4_9BACT|nr:hypothetical protein [Pelagicoccus albus]MBC2607088.1 hypothetical protein [Pelagicoccus albus]